MVNKQRMNILDPEIYIFSRGLNQGTFDPFFMTCAMMERDSRYYVESFHTF